MASAKAFQQMDSVPRDREREAREREVEIAVSGAPPPVMRARFLTRQRMVQRASWRERWVSARIKGLAPRRMMETVLPGGRVDGVGVVVLVVVVFEEEEGAVIGGWGVGFVGGVVVLVVAVAELEDGGGAEEEEEFAGAVEVEEEDEEEWCLTPVILTILLPKD